MVNQPHVLLLGNSILIDSVADSLLKRNSSHVTRISSNIQEVREFLNTLNPDMVVYELHGQNTNPIFTNNRDQAGILHLAIDLNSKQIILGHSRSKPTGSMQELCELISQEISLKNIEV